MLDLGRGRWAASQKPKLIGQNHNFVFNWQCLLSIISSRQTLQLQKNKNKFSKTTILRPSSDVVLLPCLTKFGNKFDKSTAEARRLNQTFEFGSTLARRLNQSCFPAALQSNQITITFGTAEARRLNWA